MSPFDFSGVGVLVTGATGFVGGWLAEELAARGARVVALVRDFEPLAMGVHPGLWESAVRVPGDVRDLDAVRRALADYGVTACFHLAAQASVVSALADPAGTFDANVRGTWSVLEACRLAGTLDRIVVASSDKAYGDQDRLPYEEDASPLAGRYPYDASKAAAEFVAVSYARTYGLPIAITRNGNTYGGGDLAGHRLVPEAIQAVLAGRRPVIRSDGTLERDYLYVKDAVAGYLALAEQMDRPELWGEAFNLGTGVPVSVLDLVRLVLKVAGSDLEPDVRGTATHEISRQYLSYAKAERLLRWKPAYSLEEGLRETLEWYRSRPELLRHWQTG